MGWQIQPNGHSIQEALEAALKRITNEDVRIHGSGRTDSGVHARAQVAHFDVEAKMPADKFAIAMNMLLPSDIRVLHSEETDIDFHSRFNAKRKHYQYNIQTGKHADVFLKDTCLHVHRPLDFDSLQRAASLCTGEHDFRGFMSANTSVDNTVRTIFRSQWSRKGNLLSYDVEGNGFLYNMVRILVGTMLDIGSGRLPIEAMQAALETPDRAFAGATAPAHGLTLMRVCYPDFDTEVILNEPG